MKPGKSNLIGQVQLINNVNDSDYNSEIMFEVCLITGNGNVIRNSWLIDSVSTANMFFNKEIFHDFEEVEAFLLSVVDRSSFTECYRGTVHVTLFVQRNR